MVIPVYSPKFQSGVRSSLIYGPTASDPEEKDTRYIQSSSRGRGGNPATMQVVRKRPNTVG